MTTPDRLVSDILAAADGTIVGRIRMQKIFYLLDQVGLSSGLAFHYHHFGPYSRSLDEALDRAQAVQGVKESIEYRQGDGRPYSVFTLKRGYPTGEPAGGRIGGLEIGRARELVARMKACSSTVLELAATIHWLATAEKIADWRSELVRRKGVKTENGRDKEALALLQEMGVAPP